MERYQYDGIHKVLIKPQRGDNNFVRQKVVNSGEFPDNIEPAIIGFPEIVNYKNDRKMSGMI